MKRRNLLAVAFTALTGMGLFMLTQKDEAQGASILRVSFPYSRPAMDYDPAKIHLAPEYIFLESIYSTLVEIDNDGNVIPGLAESFEWKGNDLHLSFREKKTASGKPITAEDVELSLKRVFMRSENTHGSVKSILCPDLVLKSIYDKCPELEINQNEIIFHLKKRHPFLLKLLASTDYSILLKNSFDHNSLEITNVAETSGPYYVSSDDQNGNIVLKMNHHHYNFSENSPQQVIFVPSNKKANEEILNKFAQYEIDHIPTIESVGTDHLIQFARDDQSGSLHNTQNIKNVIFVFTKKGLRRFSESERWAMAAALRKNVAEYFPLENGYELTSQYVPVFGEGALNEAQLREVKSLNEEAKIYDGHKPILVSTLTSGDFKRYGDLVKGSLPNAQIVGLKNIPIYLKFQGAEEEPDAYICNMDTGGFEDITLISYTVNAEFLHTFEEEKTKWLDKYMSIPEKDKRIELFNKIHYRSIKEAVIVPLVAAPYTAYVRKPWSQHFSKFFANNQLWKIKKD